ncbi:MAG TPA: glycosyltransferase [Xanthobacteraceae bacterium]|nr:glycosyltransferase [Xanthobacteraceae bacterium]
MSLTVLSVAYPFAPVGPDAIGGAEQVLSQLDRALTRAGHRSIVIACEGSEVAGTHIKVPRSCGVLDQVSMQAARIGHREAIQAALERWPIDVVHMHGLDFHNYLPRADFPVLVTLHLPVNWYTEDALQPRANVSLHCVSEAQHGSSDCCPGFLPPIENGIGEEFFSARHAKRNFALVLARICPEKGIHLAIDAAKRAGMPLLIAGEIFPYEAHQRYFREQIAPRLDRLRRFIGPAGFRRKRRLLASARCLLVPSLVAETSSLAAREALACGTPVIAFQRGALHETVEHGRTGYLIGDVAEMTEMLMSIDAINPAECRARARRFSIEKTIKQYFSVYAALSRAKKHEPFVGAA